MLLFLTSKFKYYLHKVYGYFGENLTSYASYGRAYTLLRETPNSLPNFDRFKFALLHFKKKICNKRLLKIEPHFRYVAILSDEI